MSRVMLVCPEALGKSHPAGIGIRFLEMQNVLRADGHDVTLLSAPVTPEQLRDVSEQTDVAVVQGHIANDFFAHARAIPTVVDLYDPFIVENLHYDEEGIFTHDHTTFLTSLLRGDLFLCASEAQRLFYLGALLAAGRVNPVTFESDPHLDQLVRVAPFGVGTPRAAVDARSSGGGILFGGVYDWYDAVLAIDAVQLARQTRPDLTLTFTRNPNPDLTHQGELARAMQQVKTHAIDFVEFVPWVPYEERGAFYDRFAAALMTFPQSIETDLSMRTRVYDYLWAGLPIVSSSAPGTDAIIERYGAIVRGSDAREYADALLHVLARPIDTRAFVDEHQWARTLAPLVAFCREPHIDESKEAFGVRMYAPERPASIIDRVKRRITRMSSRA
jgi:glycosyltransferase involved in cell wall biosynthesis